MLMQQNSQACRSCISYDRVVVLTTAFWSFWSCPSVPYVFPLQGQQALQGLIVLSPSKSIQSIFNYFFLSLESACKQLKYWCNFCVDCFCLMQKWFFLFLLHAWLAYLSAMFFFLHTLILWCVAKFAACLACLIFFLIFLFFLCPYIFVDKHREAVERAPWL